jgi:hypothetical protein
LLFFLAGGDGCKYQIQKNYWKDPNVDSVHCFGSSYGSWIQPFVHFLMPQRNGFLSPPICCYIFVLYAQNQPLVFKNMILAGVLHGLLPMSSAHSFIGVGEYSICYCFLFFPYREISKSFSKVLDYFLEWIPYGVPAFLISIPQILYLSPSSRSMFSIN